jgi:hypothetical protein
MWRAMDIPSFFTSNSDAVGSWRQFVRVSFGALILMPVLCYVFLLVIDPYDNLPFSPRLERVPVDKIQRLFHPALARKPHFDSAVIGSSNVRLLRPEQLNQVLGGHFVNLGMNAASSWEQQKIFDVFVRNHEKIGSVIFGIDYLWCKAKFADQKFVGANTAAGFPDWMYDERSDNNLPPLNLGSLKHAWWQFLAISGIRDSKIGRDGYTVFTKPMSQYKIGRARIEIYGSINPRKKKIVRPAVKMTPAQRTELSYPALSRLEAMLGTLPANSVKVFVFVPYHNFYQARQGSRDAIIWEECKARVVSLASAQKNAHVVDFMIQSPITTTDSNYWDYKHYTVEVAEDLVPLLSEAVLGTSSDANYRILYPVP